MDILDDMGVSKLSAKVFLKVNYSFNLAISFLKGIVHPKWKCWHHLLTLKWFQTCMSFFLLLNTKENILKNVGNRTVDCNHWLPLIFFPTMEGNGVHQLFNCQHSSKYLLLCSTEERNSYRFGTTWGWVNDDRILIFLGEPSL